jgi:hypothetical protein
MKRKTLKGRNNYRNKMLREETGLDVNRMK